MAANCPRHWTPPEEGSLIINCAARAGPGIAGIAAIARDCNGNMVAATIERRRCQSKLEAQLQSIRTAYKLVAKLLEEQKLEAITIETHHKRALQLIEGGIYVDEEEEDDDASEDELFGGDEEYSITLMGEDEVAKGVPQCVKDVIEKDKVLAGLGLPVTSKATKSTAKAKGDAKSSASKEANNTVESATSEATSNALTAEGSDSTVLEKAIKDLSVD